MNYIKATLFVFAVTIAFFFFSCEQATEPEIIKPGRRDYTWSVDTLQISGTYLMKMWGSSPTDVWAVGVGGGLDQTIWHYDGIDWKTDGISRSINPECIFGFSEKDIWIGGVEGRIWHYNGTNWSENLRYQNSDFERIYFMNIWGESPNDIYAVGLADSIDFRIGLMMHYNGRKWIRVNIGFKEGILKEIKKGSKTSSNYFISNKIQRTNPDMNKFFEYENNKLKEIQTNNVTLNSLTVINDEVIFTFKHGAYIYHNNSFNLVAENHFPNSWNRIYGRSSKDILWMMSDGLTHYNGADFEYILNFEKKSLSDGILFENEVFFVANDFYNNNGNNLIYHGTLK